MRRLVSREEHERRRKKNQVIAGIILVVVMVMSTLGFAIQGALGNSSGTSDSPTKVNYNGFEFTNDNGVWLIGNFVFQNGPADVGNTSLGILNDVTSYQDRPLYIYSEDSSARVEAYINLGNIANRVQDACIEGTTCSENVPVKTCSDNFIIIKESNNTAIKQDGECVYIEGQKDDLVKLTDEFLYKILGVN